ncbi:transposase domain-containing protein [Streptomyces sp. NPDC006668]|uniref:transposase domain-containing protein n=1 Tax=Streptomyces sp. NPDC006668 TaxID=3156903 RepID=UPI0033F9251F
MPLGVLASELSREAVDEVVAANGRQPRRRDSRLPEHVMVYFALALGLWSGDDCEQVMPQLTDRWGPGRLGCRPTGPQRRAGPRRPVSAGVRDAGGSVQALAEPITEILTPRAGSGRGGWWPWTAPWSTCTTPPPTTPTPVGLVAPPCRRFVRPVGVGAIA